VKRLNLLDERPWQEVVSGKPLNQRRLAVMLRAYRITPHKFRMGDATVRGYERSQFEDAFNPLLGALPDDAPSGKIVR
jgi:hypothetical protein